MSEKRESKRKQPTKEQDEGSVEVKGAILKSTIFIIGLWLAIPSPIDIGVLVLEKFQEVFPSQTITMTIWGLRFLGVLLIILDIVLITRDIREREYF